jgi:hypothetical protein
MGLNMKINKKGEMTISWIITIVLLALGFIFLLVFFFNIGGTGTLDSEICHESVIFRASMPAIAQTYLPLKCGTKKICITSSGLFNSGNCEELRGEKGITTIKVKSIGDIEKIYAEEILSCWAMMGEGKLSLFHNNVERYGVGVLPSSCVICSRIAFDKTALEKAKIDLKQINVRDYMTRYIVPNTQLTYFEYLAGNRGVYTIDDKNSAVDVSKVAGVEEAVDSGKFKGDSSFSFVTGQSLEKKDLYSSDAIVFMQVIAPSYGGVLKTTATDFGIAGGALAFSAPKLVAGTIKTLWPLAVVAGGFQALEVWANRGLSASYCQSISISEKESADGCSVVRSTGYNLADISKYCTQIESIP